MTFEYFLAIIAGFALAFNEGRGQAFNNFEHVNSENLRFGIIDHDNKLSDHPGEVKNTNIVQFLEAFSNPEHIVFRGSNAGFEPSFRGAFGSNTYDENLNRNDEEALTDDDYFIRSEGEPSRPNFVYPNTDQAYGNADFELSNYDEGSMLDDPVFSDLHLYDDVQPREILYASELSTSKNCMDQREKKVTPSNQYPTTDNVPVLCRPAIEVREPLSLAPSNVFCTKNGNPKTQITRTIGNFNSFDTNFATRIPVVSVRNEMENFPSENGPLPTTVSQLGKSTVLKEFVFPESVEKIVEVSRLVTTKKSEEFLLVPTPGDFKLVNANFHANAGETVHLDIEPKKSSASEIKRDRKAPVSNQEEEIFKPPLQEDYSVSLDEDEIKTCSKGLEPSNDRYSELGGVNDLVKLDCEDSKITEMPLPLMLHKVDFLFNTLEAILRNVFGRRLLDLNKQSEFDVAKKCWLELLEEKLLKKRTKHRPDIMDTVGNFLSVSRLNRCYASVVGLLRSQPHAKKYADYMKFLDSASSFISFTNKVENVLAKAVINEQKIYKFEPHQMNGVRRVKSGLTSSNAWQAKHLLPVALVALKSGDLASAFLWLSYIDQVYPLQQDDKYKNLLEHIIHQHDHALLQGDVQNTFTVPLMSQRLQVRQHLRDSHYNALCRGHGNQAAEENNFRFCRYLSVRPHFLLAPLKMEILNANPRIVLYHDIATAGDFLSGTESAVKVRSRYAGKLVNQKMCNASNYILSGYIRDQMPRISLAVASRLAAISNGRLKINDLEFELISPGFNRTLPSIANGTILQCQNSTTYGENGDDVSFWTIFLNDAVGGATVFPRLNLTVMPEAGAVLEVRVQRYHHHTEPLTQHFSCPVLINYLTVLQQKDSSFENICQRANKSSALDSRHVRTVTSTRPSDTEVITPTSTTISTAITAEKESMPTKEVNLGSKSSHGAVPEKLGRSYLTSSTVTVDHIYQSVLGMRVPPIAKTIQASSLVENDSSYSRIRDTIYSPRLTMTPSFNQPLTPHESSSSHGEESYISYENKLSLLMNPMTVKKSENSYLSVASSRFLKRPMLPSMDTGVTNMIHSTISNKFTPLIAFIERTQLLIEPTSSDNGAGDHLPPKDAVKTETSTANCRLGSSIVDVNKFYMLASDTERSTTTQIKNNDLGGSITTRLVLDSVSGHINTPAKVSLLNPTPVFLHGRAVEYHFQTTPIPLSLGSTSVPSTSTQRTGSKSEDNFMPLSPVTERNKFSTVTGLESRNVSNENESSSNLLDEGTMSVSNQNRSIPDSFQEQTLSRMGEKTVSANNHKQSTLDSFREQSSSRMNEETASEDNHKQRILDRFPVYDHNGNDGTTAKGENSVEQDVKESTDYTQVLKGNYDIKVSFDAFDSTTSINDLYFRISVRDGGNIMVSVAEDLCEEMSARDDDHDEQKHQATANIATKTCYEDVKRSNRFHDGYMNGHRLQKVGGDGPNDVGEGLQFRMVDGEGPNDFNSGLKFKRVFGDGPNDFSRGIQCKKVICDAPNDLGSGLQYKKKVDDGPNHFRSGIQYEKGDGDGPNDVGNGLQFKKVDGDGPNNVGSRILSRRVEASQHEFAHENRKAHVEPPTIGPSKKMNLLACYLVSADLNWCVEASSITVTPEVPQSPNSDSKFLFEG